MSSHHDPRIRPFLLGGVLLFLTCGGARAAAAQSSPLPNSGTTAAQGIFGIWRITQPSALVEIRPCTAGNDTVVCGTVVWFGRGVAPLDRMNPDKSLRARPTCGIEAISHATAKSVTEWDGAALYDPSEGSHYRGSLTLTAPNVLEVRYKWGILHQTVRWQRDTTELARCTP
jgi:uncharacterized protein (DUF2147 family)